MAESSSTGTTGNSGTTGAGSQSTSTTSTSTSTSNGGAASPGSQTSSNGSFSTGKGSGNNGNNGNNGVGPGLSFGAGVGAVNGPSIGLPGMAPGFAGFAASNFGQGWGSGNGGSSTNDNKTEPVMTVDEVYGKGNQSIVENQGDYEATSNEKSNVETSTFGKQDEISVTPLSVTENKGLVNNDAIQSVEGLNFQQKDKANQEVMEAKKSRDDAEAEDNADGMRGQLKAVAEKDAEETDAFKVGESEAEKSFNEQDISNQQILNEAKVNLDNYEESLELSKAQLERDSNKLQQYKEQAKQIQQDKDFVTKAIDYIENGTDNGSPLTYDDDPTYNGLLGKYGVNKSETTVETLEAINAAIDKQSKRSQETINTRSKQIEADQKNYEYEVTMYDKMKSDYEESLQSYNMWKQESNKKVAQGEMPVQWTQKVSKDVEAIEAEKNYEYVKDYNEMSKESIQRSIINAVETLTNARPDSDEYNQAIAELQGINQDHIGLFRGDRNAYKNPGKMLETITNEYDSQTARFQKVYEEVYNSKESEETKAKAIETINNVEANAKSVEDFANALAAKTNDPASIEAYVNAVKAYNENLVKALNDKDISKTDFNKAFTRAVAAANDFKVTKEDGTKQDYAEFAAEMARKSPELAKGLYEAKAKNYEENGHKVLAAIESAKAKMVMTWLGSKFTFADNQVRSQFNQMAKIDMRATYATYNNVLSDPNATPEQKAEASAALNQANSLMTASAALQASTGFFSGIGDGTSDGVYGTTDPGKLNGYQEALNTASNFAKIALGLGVTPGANEAYQNMYYMAGAKVNESGLFSKDFDSDGFTLCQEYGNNAAVGMIAGAGELATAVALMFNPATSQLGLNLAIDSVSTFLDGLYGVKREANKSIKYSEEILKYFGEAKDIASETGNKEVINAMSTTMDNAVKQIEDFQLKSDEVGNLDNWLEGSGSNVADNGKFNQALSYDEWLKLIEADPVMQEYAKSLNR